MLRRFGIGFVLLGCAASSSCVEQACEIVDHELVLGPFADDEPIAASLSFCDPDRGPCVGPGGSIAFFPEHVSIDSPSESDLHGAATGLWSDPSYFAVGDAGTLIVARGGFDGWTVQPLETTADLWAIATRIDVPTVIAVGEGVAVWSDDAGEHWTETALPEEVHLERLVRLPDDSILGGGVDGRLWSTHDGLSWVEQPSPTGAAITSLYVADGELLLADAEGGVHGRDADGTWSTLEVPGVAPVIAFSGRLLVWALRSDGVLVHRFLDHAWERADYEAGDGAVLAAGEYDGYYGDAAYQDDFYYEYGWIQSMCVIDEDGEIHSTTSWVEPVLACKI